MVELANSDLSKLVGDIYDCALDPSGWTGTLEKIAMILNGRNAVLLAHNPTMRSADFSLTGVKAMSSWLSMSRNTQRSIRY